ncbi:GNAT family N-acetyltransferase [bacterium]|nr:GNAT family N-acetyltransferase [bacterium]
MSNTPEDLKISCEFNPDPGDIALVSQALRTSTDAQAGPRNFTKLGVFNRDNNGGINAALIADIAWNWMFIDLLWVHDSLRHQGIGSRLMRRAEEEARKKGCEYAYLDTFSFQARPFYERLGYEVFGMLEDYPNGHKRYFMKKTLKEK